MTNTAPPGPERLQGRRVELAEHDPAWAAAYERERRTITSALGDRALLIEHAGSTSVPGLVAKPVLDLVLAVADPADEVAYVPDLARAGYVLHIREPDWHEHRFLRRETPRVNLHVFTAGSPEIARMLAFRDRLRCDPAAREHYAEVKRELAAREWRLMQDYADAKDAVVAEILAGTARENRADASSRGSSGDP